MVWYMTSRVPLRMESLLVVVLVTTGLSGCVTEGPEPLDAAMVEERLVDPLQFLPEGPLRAALAPEPQRLPQAPATASDAMRLWMDFESIPLPPVAADRPLDAALEAFATAHHATVPAHHLDSVALQPAQEVALARVILAFLAAEELQLQATAQLTDEELAFLGGHPAAVDAWSLRTGRSDHAAYEAEAQRLVQYIDVTRNLQAADLLSRAVDDLRAAMEELPSLSAPASNHLPPAVDGDGDGVPDEVEGRAGWSDDEYGDAWQPDRATDSGYGDDVLLRLPSGGNPAAGLLILGPGDSVIDESPVLLIDLGGNDRYTGQRFGGVVPGYPNDAGAILDQLRAAPGYPLVRLSVDVAGDDEYLPRPVQETHNTGVVENQERTLYGSALGGAIVGVAMLVDGSGDDLYRSTVDLTTIAHQNPSTPKRASATVYGAMHGGGVFGGVGVLSDGTGKDTYEATVRAVAQEIGGGENRPVARGVGASQGGGYIAGLGLLVDAGPGDDSFHIDLDLHTAGHAEGDQGGVQRLAASQGGAVTGAGLMVDALGTSSVAVNGPLAQAAAITAYMPLPKDFTPAGAAVTQVPRIPTVTTYPSLGFLFGSTGDSQYSAHSLSQAAAMGAHGEGNRDGTDAWALLYSQPNRGVSRGDASETFYAPAVAVLVDAGGDDHYISSGGGGVAQGSALLGATALLFDAAGDDVYAAPGASHSQGSGWLGQGVLLDQFGHDLYQAESNSQGFATDDPQALLDGRMCVGNLHSTGAAFTDVHCNDEKQSPPGGILSPGDTEYGTSQAVLRLRAQVPTIGALIDRHGIDRYEAGSQSQGAAVGVLQYTAEAGVCRTPYLYMDRVSGSLSQFDPPQPFPVPYLRECDLAFAGHRDNVEHEGEWTEPDTSGPPTNAFVLGLLLDTGNHDTYVYGGDKEPVEDGNEGDAGNDWAWSQTQVAQSTLGDARPPQDNDQSRDHGFGTPEAGGAGPTDLPPPVGEALDHPSVPEPFASVETPPQPVFGRGIDTAALDAAVGLLLRDLATSDPAFGITLTLSKAADGSNGLPPDGSEVVGGTLHAHVEAHVPDGVTVKRIKVLANSLLVGETTQSTTLDWVTTELVGGDLVFPDNTYFVQASAVLELGQYGPVSLESNAYRVNLNNAPQLVTDISTNQMSPAVGDSALLSFSITEDLKFPPGQDIPGKRPGAFIDVVLKGAQDFTILDQGYYPAGRHTFAITGVCDGGALCPEDSYLVTVTATDSEGIAAPPETEPLLMDSTPPTSKVLLPAYSGADHADSGKLVVEYDPDANPTGAPGFAALETVHVYRLPDWSTDPSSNTAIHVDSNTAGSVTAKTILPQGQPATFLTVAVDALGNSESPCTQQETDQGLPCVAHKLDRFRNGDITDTGPVTTVIDFIDPIIEDVVINPAHGFVAPGVTPVVYEVYVSETETGVASATISFDDKETYPLDPVDGACTTNCLYRYDGWKDASVGRPAQEELFVYSVKIRDHAGNPADLHGTGRLDSLPPRLSEPVTEYTLGGSPRAAGGPQSTLRILLEAEDATTTSVAGVEADFSNIATKDSPPLGVLPCDPDTSTPSVLTDWACTVILPPDVLDGEYTVTVTATDLVGNAAQAVADVLVSNTAVALSDVRVSEIGPDFVEVSWTTAPEASRRVYYGRDATSLRQSTDRDLDDAGELVYETQHTVRIDGLAPSTLYFLRAASENRAGSESLSDLVTVRTAGAVGVGFPELQGGAILSGTVDIDVDVFLRTEGDQAQVTLFSERTDGRGGRQMLAETTTGAGIATFSLDTETLGDGPVRLVAKGARGADVGEATSPDLVVDNTGPAIVPVRPLPGLGVDAAEPLFDLLVFNAGDGADLDGDGLVVRVDDEPVTPRDVVLGGSGASRTLRFTLPPLEDGEHEIAIELPDRAGNPGTATFPFTAGRQEAGDGARVDYGGRTAAHPGATVRFVYDPLLPLDAVEVDLAPLAAGTLPLARSGAWSGAWTLPDHAASGTYLLDLVTTDDGGTERIGDALTLVVDADPPVVETTATAAGPSRVDVRVAGTEATTVQVLHDGRVLHHATEGATEHNIALKGLEGGTELKLDVVVWDSSGNSVSFTRALLLPEDTTPPGAVDDLQATVHGGDVLLTWTPAPDDAGVASYRVARDGWSHAATTPQTRDRSAPGGLDVTYRVTAVDAAGNAGPARELTLAVPAVIEVLETTITPEVGDTRTPFEVVVALRHNLPDAPDVTLTVRGEPVVLEATDDTDDCRQRCWYAATTTLPASRLGAESMDLRVASGTATADAAVPATSVTVLNGPEERESPAAALLLPLLAALYVARRWRQ